MSMDERDRLIEDVPGLHHEGDETHLLREIMRTYKTMLNMFSSRVGMPAARVALLRLLVSCPPGGLGIMEIARRLDINAAAVTRQVKEMEKLRLVARRSDPRDGRRIHVRLTARGRRAFEDIHRRSHELERLLADLIGREDASTAARVLVRLRTALEGLR